MAKYREPTVAHLLEDYKAHVACCGTCRHRMGPKPNGLCAGGARRRKRWVKAKNEGR